MTSRPFSPSRRLTSTLSGLGLGLGFGFGLGLGFRAHLVLDEAVDERAKALGLDVRLVEVE